MSVNDEEEFVKLLDEEEDETEEKRSDKNPKKKIWLEILDYVKVIAIGAVVAFLLCQFVIINAEVPTSSMVPTINIDDRMIGLRLTYYFSDPKRGDVVIFKTPDPDYEGQLYVKRVIGLPGETIEIKAGQVIITDKEGQVTYLTEDYLNETPNPSVSVNNRVYTLGDDEYFMMGDNRNRSSDSRYWGNVSRKRILAKVLFKYYKGFEIIK